MNKLKIIAKAIGRYTLDYILSHWKEFATGLLGGVLAGTMSGCGGLAQSDHTTSTSVWAIGIPGVAILHDTVVKPDNRGDDTTEARQENTAVFRPAP